jgi:hypothetical protein
LRLTVFPDANAKPLPAQPEPDYTRPADAPICVETIDNHYYAYFELPRFCWDEPIYCKVRTADDTTTDLHSNKEGTLCTYVGDTANGRKIWQWIGPATSEPAPVEIIFTNGDLLTDIMPFENGGYYNYDHLLYKAGQDIPTIISQPSIAQQENASRFDLQGRQLPSWGKGIHISQGKKYLFK